MTDKGYDSNANRTTCRERGIVPVIPYRDNVKNKPNYFPRVLYKGRARIEQTMGKLKRFKRVVLRCEKTATSLQRNRRFRLCYDLGQIRSHGLGYSKTGRLLATRTVCLVRHFHLVVFSF
jgi:transposase